MQIEQIIGIAAGVLTSSSMLPQLIKIIREKKAENVSILMLLILMSGLGLWIAYGWMKKDFPIIATNGFSLLVNIILLLFRIKYAGKE